MKNIRRSACIGAFSIGLFALVSDFGSAKASDLTDLNAKPALVKVLLSPEAPKAADPVLALIELATPFQSPATVNTVLTAKLDGNAVDLLHPSDQMWILSLAPLGLVSHQLEVSVSIENSTDTQVTRLAISTLNAQIIDLQNHISAEQDPVAKQRLQADLQAKTFQKSQLQLALTGFQTPVGSDTISVSAQSNLDLNSLFKSLQSIQLHQIAIQHLDGGWDYDVTDSNILRDVTRPTADANQFGNNALGLMDSFVITHESAALQGVKRTAEYLMTTPAVVTKTSRMYANDASLLIEAANVLGFSSYRNRAATHLQADKDFAAALWTLQQGFPSNADVNAIPQATLDAVSIGDRVKGYRLRISAFEQGNQFASWGSRVFLALQLGDRAWAKAIADQVYLDQSLLLPSQSTYLLGLSTAIYCLAPFQTEDARYPAVIESLHQKILATQRADGFFMTDATPGITGDDLDAQANILLALEQIGDTVSVKRLINALLAIQLPTSVFQLRAGDEFVSAQSEMLSMFSAVYLAEGGSGHLSLLDEASNWMDPSLSERLENYVESLKAVRGLRPLPISAKVL